MSPPYPSLNPPSSQPHQKEKLHYISALRSSLTALVILHHAATTYGGAGTSPYQPSSHPQFSSPRLIGFNAFNQTFFMGTYFYLAGHFSRKALERKSKEEFVREKVWRLGVPSVVSTLVGVPVCIGIVRVWKGGEVGFRWLGEVWKGLRGVRGPVWFTATLLVFDVLFAEWYSRGRIVEEGKERGEKIVDGKGKKISSFKIFTAIGLTSAAEFLIRSFWPVGTISPPLNLNMGYLGQYIASYIFGARCERVDDAVPTPGATTALLGLSLATTFTFAHLLRNDPNPMQNVQGGWNSLALCYAMWGNVMGYAIGSSLLAGFRKHANGVSWGWINDTAFSAFLFHMPVLTVIGTATDGWEMGGVEKAAVIGSASVVASWGFGFAANCAWDGIGRCMSGIEENCKRDR